MNLPPIFPQAWGERSLDFDPIFSRIGTQLGMTGRDFETDSSEREQESITALSFLVSNH